MTTDPDIGGPSFEDRQLVYARMGLSEQGRRHIENMVLESGRRDVARAALTNVRVRHNSVKNGMSRVVESHTCELVCAYELELDPNVIGYYTQVPCRRVQRTTQHGGNHFSTAHLDFLVFRHGGVELIECKQESWLEKKGAAPGSLWIKNGSGWTHPPYADWATKHGLEFSVWVGPNPPGIYLQNLEACNAMLGTPLDGYEKETVDRALARIRSRPTTIEDLGEDIPGVDERLALWMMANAVAFGPWKSTAVNLTDRFFLYADSAQARLVDSTLLQSVVHANAQLNIQDPILAASAKDLAKARERLARLELIESGELPPSVRMTQLALRVSKAVANGQSPLSVCLTRYSKSGNRAPRLLPDQEQAIETVIAQHWNKGRVRRAKDLFHVFEKECERLGVEPSGRSRLDARRRSENPLRHALATGGFRAYHAVRPSTDPRSRSLVPLGYGQVLHIDSSDLDVRCAPDLIKLFPAAKAKFYIGLDGATGDTMAHALIFGPARTDGLALLMRECVRRNGILPRMIHVDRGPENTSRWIEEFCEGQIGIRHSPTAGSAWNGIAENAIKQVNDQVAHLMIGSTAPDQKGRKVDGRFKSDKNARTAFTTVLDRFIEFAYGHLPNTPRADGQTPTEKKMEAIATYGVMGVPCEWNDDFLIRTSVRVLCKGKPSAQRGIRTADGYFCSHELQVVLRSHLPEQTRSDCCRPDVLYVRIAGSWLKAFHSRVQSMAMLTDAERLFEMLWTPIGRTGSRRRREDLSRIRHTRLKLAEIAGPATSHLAPSQQPIAEVPSEPSFERSLNVDPEELLLPFDEREDY